MCASVIGLACSMLLCAYVSNPTSRNVSGHTPPDRGIPSTCAPGQLRGVSARATAQGVVYRQRSHLSDNPYPFWAGPWLLLLLCSSFASARWWPSTHRSTAAGCRDLRLKPHTLPPTPRPRSRIGPNLQRHSCGSYAAALAMQDQPGIGTAGREPDVRPPRPSQCLYRRPQKPQAHRRRQTRP